MLVTYLRWKEVDAIFLETRWSLLNDLLEHEAGMVILDRDQLVSY